MAPPTTTPSRTESSPTCAKTSKMSLKSTASAEVAATHDAEVTGAVEAGVAQLQKLLSVGRRKGFLTIEEVATEMGISELYGNGLDEAKLFFGGHDIPVVPADALETGRRRPSSSAARSGYRHRLRP